MKGSAGQSQGYCSKDKAKSEYYVERGVCPAAKGEESKAKLKQMVEKIKEGASDRSIFEENPAMYLRYILLGFSVAGENFMIRDTRLEDLHPKYLAEICTDITELLARPSLFTRVLLNVSRSRSTGIGVKQALERAIELSQRQQLMVAGYIAKMGQVGGTVMTETSLSLSTTLVKLCHLEKRLRYLMSTTIYAQ